MEPSALEIGLRLLVVVGFILLNAFFVAAEFAIVTVRRTRIEQLVAEGHAGARAVLDGVRDADRFVAVSQLGITIASLALGWVGEPAVVVFVLPLFGLLPENLGPVSTHAIASFIAFALITFLHMIIGEQVPKVAALHNAEGLAMIVARPTLWFGALFRPFIWLVNATTNLVLRSFGLEPASGHRLVHSVEELRIIVEQSRAAGFLEAEENEIAQRAFGLGEITARDVMIPRTEMASLPTTITLDELLTRVVDDGHSRFPVYQGTMDNVVGVIHVKDLLKLVREPVNASEFSVRRTMREPLYVPETLHANELLALMRRRNRHVAIVVDEYGGTAGMATLEDIVERLVGTMQDEFEQPEVRVQPVGDGSFLVNGLVNLSELPDAIGLEIESEDYSTIGGYVFGLLGRRPVVNDEVETPMFRARVEAVDGLRISMVHLTPKSTDRGDGHGQET